MLQAANAQLDERLVRETDHLLLSRLPRKTADISLAVVVTMFPCDIYCAQKSWIEAADHNLI